jgi:hypothetical protein
MPARQRAQTANPLAGFLGWGRHRGHFRPHPAGLGSDLLLWSVDGVSVVGCADAAYVCQALRGAQEFDKNPPRRPPQTLRGRRQRPAPEKIPHHHAHPPDRLLSVKDTDVTTVSRHPQPMKAHDDPGIGTDWASLVRSRRRRSRRSGAIWATAWRSQVGGLAVAAVRVS